MRFVLAANEFIGYECLKILMESNQNVVGVILDKKYDATPWKNIRIKRLAEDRGIKIYQPTNINDPEFHKELKKSEPDIILNIAFIQIYKSTILNLPRNNCVNFHPDPLPRYGGLNPWIWAIINNETEYGVTLHYMREKVDSGEIIGTKKFQIKKDETGLSLLMKCYKYGVILFREILQNIIEDKVIPIDQDLSQRTYFLNKIPYDGFIDVTWEAEKIERYVRAMTFSPFPNPYSPPMIKFNGNKLIINKAIVLNRNGRGKIHPGMIVNLKNKEVVMQSGDGLVELDLSKNSDNKLSENEFFVSLGIGKGSILGN